MTEHNEPINPNELELPTPQRKNEQPTTTDNTDDNKNINEEHKKNNSGIDYNDEKDLGKQTGFQVPRTEEDENSDKHHPEENHKREERENPDNPTYKDAKWQQDKMNEANNEKGVPVDSKGKGDKNTEKVNKEALVSDEKKGKGELGDARKDSIIDSPKTETYGGNPNENTGEVIKKSNYTHTGEEEKREKNNKHKVL